MGAAVGVLAAQAGDEVGIDDAELEVLVEEGLRVGDAGFDVVAAVRVGDVGDAGRCWRASAAARSTPAAGRARRGRRTGSCWGSS